MKRSRRSTRNCRCACRRQRWSSSVMPSAAATRPTSFCRPVTGRGCRHCWPPARRRPRPSAARSPGRCNGSIGGSDRSQAPPRRVARAGAAESHDPGQMDCIDLSANNTSLFLLLDAAQAAAPPPAGTAGVARLPGRRADAAHDRGDERDSRAASAGRSTTGPANTASCRRSCRSTSGGLRAERRRVSEKQDARARRAS